MQNTRKLNFKITLLTLLSIIILCTFLTAQSAHALATIRLSDGSTILDIADGSGNDLNLATGVITYVGSFNGIWTINVTTGIESGTSSYPKLDLNSINVSSTSGGTLNILFSNIGYGATPTATFLTEIGGVTDGTVLANSYLDSGNSGNNLFGITGTATSLGTLGPYNAAFSGTTSTVLDPTDPYSLTNKVTLTHTAAGDTSSFNMNVTVVPEPISSTLFIVGAATIGLRRFKKKIRSI